MENLKKLVIGATLLGSLGLLALAAKTPVNQKKELIKYEFTDPDYIQKVKTYNRSMV